MSLANEVQSTVMSRVPLATVEKLTEKTSPADKKFRRPVNEPWATRLRTGPDGMGDGPGPGVLPLHAPRAPRAIRTMARRRAGRTACTAVFISSPPLGYGRGRPLTHSMSRAGAAFQARRRNASGCDAEHGFDHGRLPGV